MSTNYKQPKSILVQHFDDHALENFHKTYNEILATSQGCLPVYISSYGGDLRALLGMIDLIEASPVPVYTIVQGIAMSCGAILALAGTKGYRYCSPYARMMLHDITCGTNGKVADQVVDIQDMINHKKIIYKFIEDHTNIIDLDKMLMSNGNVNYYFGPEEAKKIGLIDHIGIPKFTRDLTFKVVP